MKLMQYGGSVKGLYAADVYLKKSDEAILEGETAKLA